MQNNYFFLRQLTFALRPHLINFTIVTCFTQEKDELIIGCTNNTDEFYIKAILSPQFTALTFPTAFNRARQNSTNLFPDIIGKKIINVVRNLNERSFYLELEDDLSLLFKLFGNRSNIVLFRQDIPVTIFQKKFCKDLDLRLSQMNRSLVLDKNVFLNAALPLQKLVPTLGDLPLKYLSQLGYDTADKEKQWQLLEDLLTKLNNPGTYFIIRLEHRLRLTLIDIGEIQNTFTSPLEALQEFVRLYLTEENFQKKYHQVQQELKKKLEGSRNFLEQVEYKILELEYDESYAQTADLIMANLSHIPPYATEVEVYNFYTNQQVTIKLSNKDSPQKQAEKLYKKHKNRQIEIRYLTERALAKKTEISNLERLLQPLAAIQTNRELKAFLKGNNFLIKEQKTEEQSLFREFATNGFKILVGKSAKNNDILTQEHTFKEDLWLHAKDVSGSHVVIKYQAGKAFPEQVIEKAAQLAAWYSKRKNDSLCPVTYTPKKYVRKPKGAAPGAVVVEREKVILVKPGNPFKQLN